MGGINERDRYKVIDVNWGGLGIVYIVIDRFWKEIFAIKTFQDKFFSSEKKVKAFYHEAEFWILLDHHKNIVEAKYVIEIDYKPHLVMEYVDGGNLKNWIRDGRLDAVRSLQFAIQFCDGMIYANNVDLGGGSRVIVHRDIKPSNIMITKEGVVKITDFGLVKALGFPTFEMPGVGTPEYMSPEQFETIDVDTRSDIYSFGVVLYEMLSGRPPFYTLTEDNSKRWRFCKHHHQNTLPKPLRLINPNVPMILEKIVLKCIKKTPKGRFQTFEELRNKTREVKELHLDHMEA